MSTRRTDWKRFSALLLFQYRVVIKGKPDKRRTCEKRLIHFRARNAPSALAHAKQHGREAELHYTGKTGAAVHFEFVGILDLLCLGIGCSPEEVWYDIVEMMTPMERKRKIIPRESRLCAILNKE